MSWTTNNQPPSQPQASQMEQMVLAPQQLLQARQFQHRRQLERVTEHRGSLTVTCAVLVAAVWAVSIATHVEWVRLDDGSVRAVNYLVPLAVSVLAFGALFTLHLLAARRGQGEGSGLRGAVVPRPRDPSSVQPPPVPVTGGAREQDADTPALAAARHAREPGDGVASARAFQQLVGGAEALYR